MVMDKCPKCGSTEISKGAVAGARILYKSSDTKKDFFGGANWFTPFACKNCGYVEFYVDASKLK